MDQQMGLVMARRRRDGVYRGRENPVYKAQTNDAFEAVKKMRKRAQGERGEGARKKEVAGHRAGQLLEATGRMLCRV